MFGLDDAVLRLSRPHAQVVFVQPRLNSQHRREIQAGTARVAPDEVATVAGREPGQPAPGTLAQTSQDRLRRDKRAKIIPVAVRAMVDARLLLGREHRGEQVQYRHGRVRAQVSHELSGARRRGRALNRLGHELGIDLVLVGRDHEQIGDAALREPVPRVL